MIEVPFNLAALDGLDVSRAREALLSSHLSGCGPFGKMAESLVEQRLGSRTLLTTSCTHALEMSALLSNIGPDDEVIVPSFTFVSTASAFAIFGARPVFVDVDPVTLNLDHRFVEEAITDRTRAICFVHYAGVGAGIEEARALADEHDLFLVEDNAHGLFATQNDKPLGTFGRVSTNSFHETKNLTCGEGGAIVINDPSLVERAEILREKGTNRSRYLRGQVDKYTWVDIGSSWVLSDILAAVLTSQLERADAINEHRVAIWNRYLDRLRGWARASGVRLPEVPPGSRHVGHLFHMRFDSEPTRARFIEHLRSRGVLAVFHYQALHLSDVGRRFGGRVGMCPVTEDAADTLVRLPLFNSLSATQQDVVIEAVLDFSV